MLNHGFEFQFIDLGRSTFIFENLEQFSQITSKFEMLLGSTSCLAMILETDDLEEVSIAVDFLSSQMIESKFFLLQLNTVLDPIILTNKTIHFDIIISDTDPQLEGKNIS